MESGGAERVASILCNGFIRTGHSVDLVMISEKEEKSFYELDAQVKIYPLFAHNQNMKLSFINKTKLLRKHFKTKKYDTVISFLPNVNICVWLASIFSKKFLHITSERNNPFIDPQSKLKRFVKLLAFKNSDGIVCQTADAENFYKKRTKNPTSVIKNPIEPSLLHDGKESTSNNILWVGRLEPQKNLHLLIDAFHKFNSNHPETQLLIYGSGSLRGEIETKISQLHLMNNVKFLGNSDSWLSDNLDAAMFLNTSLYEGMSNSLLEAVLNQIPCIASDCPIGGSREIIAGSNNLLFENDNLSDLLSKMEYLYRNKKLISNIKATSYLLREKYSVCNIVNEWLRFIEKIDGEKHGKN